MTTPTPVHASAEEAVQVTSTGPIAVIIGAPGAGKTVVSAALGQLLGVTVRDTDVDIELAAGRTIPDIFVSDGEPAFRALERAAVAKALAEHTGVLALGGGAPLAEETQALLRQHQTVHLYVTMAQGVRRVGIDQGRPLLVGINPRATYKTLLDARLPIYRRVSRFEVDTSDLSIVEVAQSIAEWVRTR